MIRERYLQRIIPFIETDLIKVLTGMRRSGKSVMLKIIQDYLMKQGVLEKQFFCLNFEDLANEPDLDYRALNAAIEAFVAENESTSYIFLDEIQEVESFEKVINSIRAVHGSRVDIYVTGSNSTLLSGELSTYIAGRYIQFDIHPFSFSEHVSVRRYLGDPRSDEALFRAYLVEGGMPFTALHDIAYNDRITYLSDVYNSIILKDIIQREQIRDSAVLRRLLNYVFANTGRTFSARSIANSWKHEGISVSVTTILNYLSYAQAAYAILPLRRYDIQRKAFLSSQEKYYVADHGLRQAIVGRNEEDIELILENIVLLELLARGYSVFVGKTKQYEIDFVAERRSMSGTERTYIQVSYLLASPETRRREFRPLLETGDHYEKLVLSLDPLTADQDGVKHVNLVEWLLNP